VNGTPHRAFEEVEFDPEINSHKIYNKVEDKLLAEKAQIRLAAQLNRSYDMGRGPSTPGAPSARTLCGFNQYAAKRLPL